MFNRRFFICQKCACNIIEKAINADPICRKCDMEEMNELDNKLRAENELLKKENRWLRKDRAFAWRENEKNCELNCILRKDNAKLKELNAYKATEREIRHYKYKRCFAMTEWCDAEADVADADGDYESMRWYQKWHERWMELAEKFKEKK